MTITELIQKLQEIKDNQTPVYHGYSRKELGYLINFEVVEEDLHLEFGTEPRSMEGLRQNSYYLIYLDEDPLNTYCINL